MADAYWELAALARSYANTVGRIIFFSFIIILDEDALVDNCLNRQGHWGTEHCRKIVVVGPRFNIRQSSSRSFVQEPSGLEYLGIIWRVYQLPRPGQVGGDRYDEM